MDTAFRDRFIARWNTYFPHAELPVAFYYTDDSARAPYAGAVKEHRCFIGDLAKIRKGKSLQFDIEAVSCPGGKRYLGFSQALRPNFEYFLSCGIKGVVKGERYKRSPEIVEELMKCQPPWTAPGRFIVFKRVDKLNADDDPHVAVFFAPPDVLSGLFTLVNFDQATPEHVTAPFCAGCASIVYWPWQEANKLNPRAVLGMFDVSARPSIAPNLLTMAIAWKRLVTLTDYMDESFLVTESWGKVRKRIARLA
jgi:hypothetical protein